MKTCHWMPTVLREAKDLRLSSSLQLKWINSQRGIGWGASHCCQQKPEDSAFQSWRGTVFGWLVTASTTCTVYPSCGALPSAVGKAELPTLSQDSIILGLEFSPCCLPNSYSFFSLNNLPPRALAWSPIAFASYQSITKLSGLKQQRLSFLIILWVGGTVPLVLPGLTHAAAVSWEVDLGLGSAGIVGLLLLTWFSSQLFHNKVVSGFQQGENGSWRRLDAYTVEHA